MCIQVAGWRLGVSLILTEKKKHHIEEIKIEFIALEGHTMIHRSQ